MRENGLPATTPVSELCSETDFISLLREAVEPLLRARAISKPGMDGPDHGRKAFSFVEERTLELESFLDDYHAKTNQTFAPIREYVASARGFASTGLHIADILVRHVPDLMRADSGRWLDFKRATVETLQFIRRSLSSLLHEAVEEVGRLFGTAITLSKSPEPVAKEAPRFVLPRTLDHGSVPEINRHVAEMAGQFLGHKQILEQQSGGMTFSDPEEMRRFVREVGDEQQVRYFTTRIRNVLSRYDTYVLGTSTESQDTELPHFRRQVDLMHLLLQCMTELVHFYERHEDDIRFEQAKNRIAELVDKQQVLDRVLNFSLFYLHILMDEAVPVAERLVNRYTSQSTLVCMIPADVYLHARPVSLIARIVNYYGTPVTMRIGKSACYAGSILQILMAAGANVDAREVTFDGDRRTLDDLQLLFEHRLGESGKESLPEELSYLGY